MIILHRLLLSVRAAASCPFAKRLLPTSLQTHRAVLVVSYRPRAGVFYYHTNAGYLFSFSQSDNDISYIRPPAPLRSPASPPVRSSARLLARSPVCFAFFFFCCSPAHFALLLRCTVFLFISLLFERRWQVSISRALN